ncbi:sugar transferase [Bacillus sp. ISL-45]|uniref:sugar transferase n=1 Tax=Bacillus sp. ISL-45 TaxID=2819128 RepID=UPI003339D422
MLDLTVSIVVLALLIPVFILAAAGIKLTSPGPVFYKAKRIGLGGEPFIMYKFRTMHVLQAEKRLVTSVDDPRIFSFGALLRKSKVDELPQLLNVLMGDMSIVGPRPEDPVIVERHYTEEQLRTLGVLPGLTSPGSLYYYTSGESLLTGENTDQKYIEDVMPMKLAIDLCYTENISFMYDLKIMLRTAYVIVAKLAGRKNFKEIWECSKIKTEKK